MIRFFNKEQAGDEKLEDSLENIETFAMETVEYVIGEVNRIGCFDVFNYWHNRLRENEQDYAMVDGANLRKNYLLNQSERVNCAYEKTLETMNDFYESFRRG